MSHRRAAVLVAAFLTAVTLVPGPVPTPARAVSHLVRVAPPRPRPNIRASAWPVAIRALGPPAPAEPRVVLGAVTSQPIVALTFDLDMTPDMAAEARRGVVPAWINQDALGVLRTTGTRATLFMTGMWAELYPGLARSLALDPQFEIANHSYSHPAFHLPCYLLGGLGPGGAAWQLKHAQAVLRQITGVTPRYFRFPGGCYDRPAVDAVHTAGLIPVEWTVNAMDAFNPNATGVAATVLAHVKPGAIILMHLQGGPNAPATGPALRLIIPSLRRRGYRFVTVGQLLETSRPLQPADPHEVVQAYQPAPAPAPAPPPAAWSLVVLRAPPVHPCWRWDPRLRIWVRC